LHNNQLVCSMHLCKKSVPVVLQLLALEFWSKNSSMDSRFKSARICRIRFVFHI
jgi:hypothetical protein